MMFQQQHQAYLLLNSVPLYVYTAQLHTIFDCTYLKINKNIVKINYTSHMEFKARVCLYYFGNHAHKQMCIEHWQSRQSRLNLSIEYRVPSAEYRIFNTVFGGQNDNFVFVTKLLRNPSFVQLNFNRRKKSNIFVTQVVQNYLKFIIPVT